MKFFPGFLVSLAIAWGQTCAPSLPLRPNDATTGALDETRCRLSDGTAYADYVLTIPSHGALTITTNSDSFPASAILRDASGHKLNAGGTVQQRLEPGNYHVLVNAAAPGQTGSFTLRTAFQREPDVLCQAFPRIGAGRGVTGQLTASSCTLPDGSRYDGYAITVYGSGTLNIGMDSADFNAYVILRNENGALLASGDNAGSGTSATISTQVTGNETYTIVAAAASASEKLGQYKLSVAFTPALDETCRTAKIFTDSDQVAGTVALGSCGFNLPDREDSALFNFYDLQVATAGVAQIQVRGATFSPLLLLLDADGNPVAEDTQSGGPNVPLIRQQLAPGNYRVIVFDEDSYGGDYTLQYTFHPGLPEICPVLTLDGTRSLTGTLDGSSSCRTPDLMADVYQLVLAQSGTLDLNLSSGDFTTGLELRDAKDNLLTSGDPTSDGSSSRVLADLPAGSYSVAASSLDSPGGYNIGYQFTPKALAPCTNAQSLPVNSGYIGQLGVTSCTDAAGRPYDLYQFTTAADGTVAAFMTSKAVDSLLTLTDASGNVLRFDDNSYGDGNSEIVQYLSAGTYRLQARASGSPSIGFYRVDVLFAQGPRPAFCAPKTLSVGAVASGTLSFTSCQYLDNTFADFYQFTIGDPGQVLDIRASSAAFDPSLILLDAKGNVLGSGDNGLQQNVDPGTYYLVLKPASDPSQSGGYSLTVTAQPAP